MDPPMSEVVTSITTLDQLETKFNTLVNAPGLLGTVYTSYTEPPLTAATAGKQKLNVFREELDKNNKPISREHHILEYVCETEDEAKKVDIKMRHMEKVSEAIIRREEADKRREEADKKKIEDDNRANKQTWFIALIGIAVAIAIGFATFFGSQAGTNSIIKALKNNHDNLIKYMENEKTAKD